MIKYSIDDFGKFSTVPDAVCGNYFKITGLNETLADVYLLGFSENKSQIQMLKRICQLMKCTFLPSPSPPP